jgi:diaminohydroxyphosphoribosylaminopyrimidine deaminase/5-amino-6-(5-phosphoribosylamino)uracil reductase
MKALAENRDTAAAIDHRFMQLALALGRRGLGRTWPNPAVGAVIVRESAGGPIVVGRGWTQAGGRPHAETEALRRAGAAARGATLYVTLEPCSHHGKTPPCADAIITAGITRVVSAMEDPNLQVAGEGHARLRAAGIAVEVGVGAAEARRVHAGHIIRIREGRPYVTLKLAISTDGKVALAGRRPIAITGEEARTRVHLLRAQSDAILIGIGTARADDPALTCRLPGMLASSPVRVVLDRALRLSPDGVLARTAGETPVWVFAGTDAAAAAADALRAKGIDVIRTAVANGRPDVAAVLRELAARGITRLLVEGGPMAAAAFVSAGLVDAAVLLHSRMNIGPEGVDALDGLPIESITESPRLKRVGIEQAGTDTIEFFERG